MTHYLDTQTGKIVTKREAEELSTWHYQGRVPVYEPRHFNRRFMEIEEAKCPPSN